MSEAASTVDIPAESRVMLAIRKAMGELKTDEQKFNARSGLLYNLLVMVAQEEGIQFGSDFHWMNAGTAALIAMRVLLKNPKTADVLSESQYAAAPDLLKACKAACHLYEQGCVDRGFKDEPNWIDGVLNQLIAAISKATP